MFIWKFICENRRADYNMVFDFVDCKYKLLSRPWRFPITGWDRFVTRPSTYPSYMLYGYLAAITHVMDILTSTCMLLLIFAASGLTDDFKLCTLGHVFGGCIGSVTVNWLVSAFWLCANEWRIECSAGQSASVGSAHTLLRRFCIHDLPVWNRRGRWYRKEVGSPEPYIFSIMSEWNK